ncbi:hypothetical protein Tco_0558053 [Tanacetum coccineum]
MKVEESLNVTFDETPPLPKTPPLEDDELVEEEAIESTDSAFARSWDVGLTILAPTPQTLNLFILQRSKTLPLPSPTKEAELCLALERYVNKL